MSVSNAPAIKPEKSSSNLHLMPSFLQIRLSEKIALKVLKILIFSFTPLHSELKKKEVACFFLRKNFLENISSKFFLEH